MTVDREQIRRDSPSIERDVVTVRGFLDYPTASGRDVYLRAVEALDRLALAAHRAEQAEALAEAVQGFLTKMPAEWDGGDLGYEVGGLHSMAQALLDVTEAQEAEQ